VGQFESPQATNCIDKNATLDWTMPMRINKKTSDANQIACRVAEAAATDAVNVAIKRGVNEAVIDAIDSDTLSQVMVQMSRKGPKIDGKRRWETMTAKESAKKVPQSG
jgi:hypothetical protein